MKTKTVRSAIAVAAFATVAGIQPASAQNFFEMLFGGARFEGRSAYQPDTGRQNALPGYARHSSGLGYGTLDPNDPRLRRAIIRHRAAAKPAARKPKSLAAEASGPSIKNAAILSTPDAPRGSVAFFLKDKTLRAGDVVVTEKGFLVFQGGDHSTRAFIAINDSGSLKGERKNLLALQEVSRMRTPNLTVETTAVMRDFVGPRLPDQMDERFNAALMTKTASR